jgi:hypothetical protein
MADIINLRRARKAKKRDEAAKGADANRLAFGRTKAEKQKTGAERKLAETRLAGHRLTPEGER